MRRGIADAFRVDNYRADGPSSGIAVGTRIDRNNLSESSYYGVINGAPSSKTPLYPSKQQQITYNGITVTTHGTDIFALSDTGDALWQGTSINLFDFQDMDVAYDGSGFFAGAGNYLFFWKFTTGSYSLPMNLSSGYTIKSVRSLPNEGVLFVLYTDGTNNALRKSTYTTTGTMPNLTTIWTYTLPNTGDVYTGIDAYKDTYLGKTMVAVAGTIGLQFYDASTTSQATKLNRTASGNFVNVALSGNGTHATGSTGTISRFPPPMSILADTITGTTVVPALVNIPYTAATSYNRVIVDPKDSSIIVLRSYDGIVAKYSADMSTQKWVYSSLASNSAKGVSVDRLKYGITVMGTFGFSKVTEQMTLNA